jgi:hypothetical protein
MGPVKLIERATSSAVHAVRHPVSSVAYAAGLARGLAGVVFHGARTDAPTVPAQRDEATPTATTAGPPEPQRVMKPVPEPGDLPEPIVIEPRDEEPGEAFTTEPKAVSRESAHGGSDLLDAEVDAWEEEAHEGLDPDDDADLPQPPESGVLDPGVAKAIRSESEMLRRGAGTSTD